MSTYVFDLEPDDNGTFLATCAAFPEVVTFVDEPGQLFFVGVGAIEEAIAARIADGRPIPDPATPEELRAVYPDEDGTVRKAWVKLPHLTTLKLLLYKAIRGQDITRADLQRRLGWNRESVDRLFRLDHRSRVEQIEAALLELGLELVTDALATTPDRAAMIARMKKAVADQQPAESGTEEAERLDREARRTAKAKRADNAAVGPMISGVRSREVHPVAKARPVRKSA